MSAECAGVYKRRFDAAKLSHCTLQVCALILGARTSVQRAAARHLGGGHHRLVVNAGWLKVRKLLIVTVVS